MTGSIKKRGEQRYAIILHLGYETNPETGIRKRKQKWIAFRGTREAAEKELRRLCGDLDNGRFVEPSKLTVLDWMREWIKTIIAPSEERALRTREDYERTVEKLIAVSFFANVLIQKVRASHLRQFYADLRESGLAVVTLVKIHSIIKQAFDVAVAETIVPFNIAENLKGKPKQARGRHQQIIANTLDVEETDRLLAVAEQAGPQKAALYHLAVDSGMRKSELAGLRWSDVQLETNQIRVAQQLIKGPKRRRKKSDAPREPQFDAPKNGLPRTFDISPKTTALLKAHKAHQAELKMRHRLTYHDYDLVFAKEWDFAKPWNDVVRRNDVMGDPLQIIATRELAPFLAQAGVKKITFHGLRHTCATLLLLAGVSVKVVSERLGHADPEITLRVYAHVLPGMQKEAAERMAELLKTARSKRKTG